LVVNLEKHFVLVFEPQIKAGGMINGKHSEDKSRPIEKTDADN